MAQFLREGDAVMSIWASPFASMKMQISTADTANCGVECDLVTEMRPKSLNPPTGKDFFEHVEAHESAGYTGTPWQS